MIPDKEWLRSPEGRKWLETEEGTKWVVTDPDGIAWSESREGHDWFDELAQSGFEAYFRGEAPEPPSWGIRPNDAPLIGSRVRLLESQETLGGASFKEGELMIVDKLTFTPMGLVNVSLRTVDGRKLMSTMRGMFVSAAGSGGNS